MSDYSLQRRLAAEILGIGESRVKIRPRNEDEEEELQSAITREDVKRMIKLGVIYEEPIKSNSRGRWRELREKRRKGQRRGPGKRKGKATARADPKREWINRIRKMRRYLKYLRDKKQISTQLYRKYYRLAKGGAFSTFNALKMHLEKELSEEKR
jgi:large subunit ribosomal protein L19e